MTKSLYYKIVKRDKNNTLTSLFAPHLISANGQINYMVIYQPQQYVCAKMGKLFVYNDATKAEYEFNKCFHTSNSVELWECHCIGISRRQKILNVRTLMINEYLHRAIHGRSLMQRFWYLKDINTKTLYTITDNSVRTCEMLKLTRRIL
jgi:hypothetical protein